MSNRSTIIGHAYEYICANMIAKHISKFAKVDIDKTSTYCVGMESWDVLNEKTRNTLEKSAKSLLNKLCELEPNMINSKNGDVILVRMQSDLEGVIGDVRDIVINKKQSNWEIGISLKHNHFTVKHSRLSMGIDFCERWFEGKGSDTYFKQIKPIFDLLESKKKQNKKWSDIKDKQNNVYVPVLNAFIEEIKRSYEKDKKMPAKMVEYLLGKYDFYKVVSQDSKKLTTIQPFNFRGTLNQQFESKKPTIIIPKYALPTRLVNIEMKPGSSTTVEMFFDNGWQFSFRIHSASTYVETSLKFDIQLIGMPTSIITINCEWK